MASPTGSGWPPRHPPDAAAQWNRSSTGWPVIGAKRRTRSPTTSLPLNAVVSGATYCSCPGSPDDVDSATIDPDPLASYTVDPEQEAPSESATMIPGVLP